MSLTITRRWRLLACLLLLLAACLLSLSLGAKPIALSVVLDSLGGDTAHPDSILIREGRLPRTVLGLVAGSAMGVSGTLIQALTRNPLADPGILGVNAGASFAVVVGVALGASGNGALMALAFAGALLTTVLIYLTGSRGVARIDPLRFILAGVAIGAVMSGLSSAITLLDPPTFDRVRYWAAGTLDVRALAPVLLLLPLVAGASLLAMLLARPLNTLSLGPELALTLGARPQLTQAGCIVAITMLSGASTAVTGPIGFVGLMIPHVARRLAGSDMRWILPFSMLLAPVLLLAADVLGRVLVPGELRVSIVTAFVGAPVMIWLARRREAP